MKVLLLEPSLVHSESADNLERIRDCLAGTRGKLSATDLVVLPERYELRADRARYEHGVAELARELGCYVIGGSQRELRGETAVNSGVAADGAGAIVGRYEKLRPYGVERQWVEPGSRLGEFTIDGRRVLVLICADFWFVDLILRASAAPDVIVVPALSVTREPTPHFARALWQHLAISRAYEFGSYVAVSDWAEDSSLPALTAAGVAGLADPTTRDPGRLFRKLAPGERSALLELDFDALEAFRRDRRARGFYWRTNNDTPL